MCHPPLEKEKEKKKPSPSSCTRFFFFWIFWSFIFFLFFSSIASFNIDFLLGFCIEFFFSFLWFVLIYYDLIFTWFTNKFWMFFYGIRSHSFCVVVCVCVCINFIQYLFYTFFFIILVDEALVLETNLLNIIKFMTCFFRSDIYIYIYLLTF